MADTVQGLATALAIPGLPGWVGLVLLILAGMAALALLAMPMRRAAVNLRNGLKAWKESRKAFKEDQKLWNVALQDSRVMADLSRAMSRDGMREVRGYY